MSNPCFLLRKVEFKKSILLFFPVILFLFFILKSTGESYDGFGLLALTIKEAIMPFMILIYLSICIMDRKNLFYILYSIFLIFYFLLFIYSLVFNADNTIIYKTGLFPQDLILFANDALSFPFIIVFIVYTLIMKKKILRYIFAFLTAFSHIALNLYVLRDNGQNILENIVFMMTKVNEQYYLKSLYFIPLSFAVIQLIIEAYYFYMRNKPILQRYKRLQKYKGKTI